MKIKWKRFKITFPLICNNCGYLHNMKREYCESCGDRDNFRETTKKDLDTFNAIEEV